MNVRIRRLISSIGTVLTLAAGVACLRSFQNTDHREGTIRRRLSPLAIPRMWRRALSTLALTFVFVLGLTQNAYADVVAENSGVRGRGDWTWSTYELRNVYLGVRDLACDDDPVYVHLRVYTRAGDSPFDTTHREHNGGCGTARNWYNLGVTANFAITGVKVRACVDRNWPTGDDCDESTYHDNPRT